MTTPRARALAFAAAIGCFAGASAAACYPDFEFDQPTGSTSSDTSSTSTAGGSGGSGGSVLTSSSGVAVVPCGVYDPDTKTHATTCAPNQSCCFAPGDDEIGLNDTCVERGNCAGKEYQCRGPADCGAGSECCSPFMRVDNEIRPTGPRCVVGACPNDEAEMCDPLVADGSQCPIPLECVSFFGNFGACFTPPETTSASSAASTTATSSSGGPT